MDGEFERRVALSRPTADTADARRCLALVCARIAPDAKRPAVGRFILTERIGQGGFGEVYAAQDPTLRRTVAVKLLHVHAPASSVLEEARAMATLAHPNIVAVHDVGEHDGEPYLVMDFVNGPTLGRWLRDDVRTWREISRVLVDVARGVAAAHAAGLVHRDLKPGNVLVETTPDARALVTDFGLAAWVDGEALTAVPGTRGYIAPELRGGAPFVPSADQYSYCVLALEALEHAERSPPAALVSTLKRGLRGEPASRWPSMSALAEAIDQVRERGPRRRRIALGLLGLAGIAGGVTTVAARPDPAASCSASAEAVSTQASIAGPRIISAFADAAPGFGASVGEDVGERVQQRADALAIAWSNACDADSETPSGRRAQICLEQQSWELTALIEVFEHADVGVVEHASEAVAMLAEASSCFDAEPGQPVPSAEQVIATVEARRALARAQSLQHAGRYTEALEAATDAHRLGQSARYETVSARAAFRRGVVLAYLEDYEAAVEQFRSSLASAYASGESLQVAWAQVLLAQVSGGYLGDTSAGETWLTAARASLVDQTVPVELDEALLSVDAMLAEQRGAYDDAIEQARTLVERRVERLPSTDPRIANTFTMLGNLQYRAQRIAAADASYVEALQRRIVVLGPDHPQTGVAHNNASLTAVVNGDFDAAREHLSHAVRIAESSGSQPVARLRALLNLALVDLHSGDAESAQRALAQLDDDADEVASARLRARVALLRGDAALERGALDEASSHYRRASEGWPEDHPQHVGLRYRQALVASTAGRFEEAAAGFRRAARFAITVHGPTSPIVLGVRAGAAENAAASGERALAETEIAAIRAGSDAAFSGLSAASRLELARAFFLVDEPASARALLDAMDPLVDARERARHVLLEAELAADAGERVDVQGVRAALGDSIGRYATRLAALERAHG